MLVLGIETSCDETSASVVEDGWRVRSCVIASSGKDFARLGGVIPEMAARAQLESILPVIATALADANLTPEAIDLIAMTTTPGLIGSLLVGTTTAHTLARVWKKPIQAVHHTLGHLCSIALTEGERERDAIIFPVLTLSVSGGHTDLWLRSSHTDAVLIGTTKDDAAGEAFDKGALLLGLPYPGGPAIEQAANSGGDRAFEFPMPLERELAPDFSFSGLKTALRSTVHRLEDIDEAMRRDIAASYQRAIVLHLASGVNKALKQHAGIRSLHLVGGVAANKALRVALSDIASANGLSFMTPATNRFCTDNAAMIAAAGYHLTQRTPGESLQG